MGWVSQALQLGLGGKSRVRRGSRDSEEPAELLFPHQASAPRCKWCTNCPEGACIGRNGSCTSENDCRINQREVFWAGNCSEAVCGAADCEQCTREGKCMWTRQFKRTGKAGSVGRPSSWGGPGGLDSWAQGMEEEGRGRPPGPGSDSCVLDSRGDPPHSLSAAHLRLDVLQPLSAERVPDASGIIAPTPLPHSLSPPAQLHLLPGLQGCGRGLAALCLEQQPPAGTAQAGCPGGPPYPDPARLSCLLLHFPGSGPTVVLPLSSCFLSSPTGTSFLAS